MVAAHAPILVAHVAPDREHAVGALLLVADHRHGHISGLPGLHQREKRVLGAVGVPEGEDRVVGEAVGLVDFPVETPVTAVHVHVHRRIDHRVVVGRVEHRFLVLGTIDPDAFQFAVPGLGGLGAKGVEPLPLGLRPQVLQGPFHAHGRQGDLHLQHGAGGRIELEPCNELAPRHLREVVFLVKTAPETGVQGFFKVFEAIFRDGLREFHREIGIVRPGPSVSDPIAGEMAVVHHPHLRPKRLPVVVVNPMLQVDDNVPIGPFRESIAVHAHARGGRHLGADAVVRQRDGVIAELGHLAVMAESGTVASFRAVCSAGVQPDVPGSRHHQHIPQVRMPRPAEMRMAEPYDRRILVPIPRAVLVHALLILPAHVVGNGVRIRTQLHDTERRAGPGKGMAHAVGPDQRIDIISRLLCLSGNRDGAS